MAYQKNEVAARISKFMKIHVYIHYVTDKAVLVSQDGNEDDCWLPLSQLIYDNIGDLDIDEWRVIRVPKWLARERDLTEYEGEG